MIHSNDSLNKDRKSNKSKEKNVVDDDVKRSNNGENSHSVELIDFTPRLYQEMIFSTCAKYNTLVVIPTGLGKTFIFLMTAVNRLNNYPNMKVVLLGPTRPLVDQYYSVFKKHTNIAEEKMAIFTGKVPPSERAELWKKSQIIFSTPQGFMNDVIGSRIDISEVSLMGFDEAHRAVGDYAYVWIAKYYERVAKFFRIVAMTASPGSDVEKIQEVCDNLFIEKIEIRSEKDPDVVSYIQPIRVHWLEVKLPEELKKIRSFLKKCFDSKIKELRAMGFFKDVNSSYVTKTQLLKFQSDLRGMIHGGYDANLLKGISLVAEALKVEHAIYLVETQDIYVLKEYMKKLMEDAENGKVKAVKRLVADPDFKAAFYLVLLVDEKGMKHPKLVKLIELVSSFDFDSGYKIIIFTQYRDSVTKILSELERIKGVKPVVFVGQAKKKNSGLSQKEQKRVLNDFGEGKYNVLISTSVGEEGIDIPNVDAVVFYETVPSAIRQIQRRGRTGRQSKGQLYILYTRGTRDEAFRWSAFRKEKRMYSILNKIKREVVVKSMKGRANSSDNVTLYNSQNHHDSNGSTDDSHLDLNVREKKQEKQNHNLFDFSNKDSSENSNGLDNSINSDNQGNSGSSDNTYSSSNSKNNENYGVYANNDNLYKSYSNGNRANGLSNSFTNSSNNSSNDNSTNGSVGNFNDDVNHNLNNNLSNSNTLSDNFIDNDKVRIIVDTREKLSHAVRELMNFNVNIDIEQLDVGDYVLSDDCALEFKNAKDFVSSIIDKRLFDQAGKLKSTYKKSFFIVEGDVFSVSRIHPNAIRGALISIMVDFGVPIIFTKSPKESANYIYTIAMHLQRRYKDGFSSKVFDKPTSLGELQLKIAASLPGVGNTLAKPLIEHFGSLKRIADSEINDFLSIEKFGPKRAKGIYDLFRYEYGAKKSNHSSSILDDIYNSINSDAKK
ncbi:MAG: DEAD/DEAH box helicase [Nitrospiraceae bacterium]|nr:DEAD/DEAH box helicase [Nitrospiraceae bacterium]